MEEKDLLILWNKKRTQIINAQVGPTLMLIGVFVLAGFDTFSMAADSPKFLVLGVAAVTGILSLISQYAAIREAETLVVDPKRVTKPSALATKVAESRSLLSLTAIVIVGFGIATFALVAWAVLGK